MRLFLQHRKKLWILHLGFSSRFWQFFERLHLILNVCTWVTADGLAFECFSLKIESRKRQTKQLLDYIHDDMYFCGAALQNNINILYVLYNTIISGFVYSSIYLFTCAHLSFEHDSFFASKRVLPFRLTGQSWSTSLSCKPRYTQLHERHGKVWKKFSHAEPCCSLNQIMCICWCKA